MKLTESTQKVSITIRTPEGSVASQPEDDPPTYFALRNPPPPSPRRRAILREQARALAGSDGRQLDY